MTIVSVPMVDGNGNIRNVAYYNDGSNILKKVVYNRELINRLPPLDNGRFPATIYKSTGQSTFTNLTVNTTLGTFSSTAPVGFSYRRVAVDITNTGSTALNSFVIQAEFTGTTNFTTIANSSSSYTSINVSDPHRILVAFYLNNPATLTAGQRSIIIINVSYIFTLRLRATTASGSTTLSGILSFTT